MVLSPLEAISMLKNDTNQSIYIVLLGKYTLHMRPLMSTHATDSIGVPPPYRERRFMIAAIFYLMLTSSVRIITKYRK